MLTKSERVQEVADELIGSAQDLNDVLSDEEQNDTDFLKELDEHVYQCDQCGWWVERNEVNGDGYCSDCQEEE